ncbi:hypothetical protein PR202_gb25671 [Eleusine coracana subsp. coracana]|uniref:Thioredoxin domain-containing protein n=1 Tax=Eleusine coracana subsp. coracana TaxID=191504 RepID=A0AAV5FQK2_ELECO|nr:hypothetical protein PR202_gb25671 [Eleusine coracana subsp. coracana]
MADSRGGTQPELAVVAAVAVASTTIATTVVAFAAAAALMPKLMRTTHLPLACTSALNSDSLMVLDKHLSILAQQHVETRFIKVHAEKAPFLTEKLRIVVLPTLAIVKNTKVEDYVVGFDELGSKDDFSTEDLEERLAKSEVIFLDGEGPSNPSKNATKRSVRQSNTGNSSDSE